MAVDGGHQQRAGAIAGAHLVDVGAGVDQRQRRLALAVARGQQQRRQAAVRADQIGVAERLGLVAVVVGARRRRGCAARAGAAGDPRPAAAARSRCIAAIRGLRARLSAESSGCGR